MDLEVFTLCDAAADYQGRLSILGIFDTIYAQSMPATHHHCAIAIRLRIQKIEEGSHALSLHVVDIDGAMVIPPLDGQFGIQMMDKDKRGTTNLVLNLEGLTFKRYGEYAVNLAIDKQAIGTLPFWVKPVAKQEAQ
jgi:hypothetical protein